MPLSCSTPSLVTINDHDVSLSAKLKESIIKKNKYVFHSPLMLTYPIITDKNFSVYKVCQTGD